MKEINAIIQSNIGAIALCDDMVFVPDLPKTRSGKIMRRILRSITKGEEITQDTSTLEDPSIVGVIEGVRGFFLLIVCGGVFGGNTLHK